MDHAVAQPRERLAEQHRQGVDALGDASQALRAVIHGVHARHHREQHLRRTDVRRRLLAADVLLSGLQRHAQRRAAGRVLRHADDAAGDVALVLLAGREERRVRPAVAHRNAEPLGASHGDVGPPLAGRRQQRQREQVRRRGHERACGMGALAERAIVFDLAIRGGILQQRADYARPEIERVGIGDHGLHAPRLGPRAHHGDGLWMTPFGDQEQGRGPRGHGHDGFGQVHRLRRGRGLIEQGGVRDRQGGQIGDHRLEVQQRFQPTLCDLGLVGRVRRVPARVLDDVALDHLRSERVVVPHPDVGAEQLILSGHAPQRLEHLALGTPGRQRQRPPQADVGGHDGIDECVERLVPERRQHTPRLVRTGADVTRHETVGRGEGSAHGGHGCRTRMAAHESGCAWPGLSTTTCARPPTCRLKSSGSARMTSNVL